MAKRKTILKIPKYGQATLCAPSAPAGCSVSEYPMWAVMCAHKWSSVTTAFGMPVHGPKEGPHGFIPLFFTREQAIAWAGEERYVVQLTQNNEATP